MKTSMRAFGWVSLILAVLTQTSVAGLLEGFTYMSPSGKNVFWAKMPIRMCVTPKVPENIRKQFAEAIEVWNNTFHKKIFQLCKYSHSTYRENRPGMNGVYWITEGFEKFTDKTSLARTVVGFDDSGKIVNADILLNGEYYDWAAVAVDSQTIFIHELGHVLGLKHFFLSLDSAMNYYPYVSGYVHRSIGSYEKLVFSHLYENSQSAVQPYLGDYFRGDISRAIGDLETQSKRSTQESYALAYLYKVEKKYELAKLNFLKVLESENHNYVRLQLADVMWSLRDPSAQREFLKVIEENPKNYEALADLGSMFLSNGDTAKGIEYLKKSLAIQPAHWGACELLLSATKDQKYKACVARFGPKRLLR